MSEWKEYKLGDLGLVITGKTPSKNNPEDWGNDMPFVTPSDYKNYGKNAKDADRNLSQSGINRLKGKVLPANSILVTCIGSDMGKAVVNKTNVITNQQINSIIPNSLANSDFLYYRLVSIYETLRIYGGDGTAVPIVNKRDFENIETEIPPLPEQTAIASVLSSLDDKIDLLHRQNATLEKMAETLFRQWFVEEAKEEWEEKTLGEITEIKAGGDKPKIYSDTKTEECKVPIFSNGIDKEGLYGFTNTAKIFKECITISARGTIGFVCLRQEPFVPIVRLISIVPNKKYLSVKYLYLWAKTQDILGTGTTQEQLTVPDFSRTKIVLPPFTKMVEFTNHVDTLFRKKDFNQTQIRTLTALRDTLLPKLMSGEVKVEMEQEVQKI